MIFLTAVFINDFKRAIDEVATLPLKYLYKGEKLNIVTLFVK